MARWDGFGYQNDLAEYYAGQRSQPPQIPDVYITESFVQEAKKQARIIQQVRIKEQIRRAEYDDQWARKTAARLQGIQHRLSERQRAIILQSLEILEELS